MSSYIPLNILIFLTIYLGCSQASKRPVCLYTPLTSHAHPVSSCCRGFAGVTSPRHAKGLQKKNPEQRGEAIKAHIWTQHMPALMWICFTPACGHINDSFFFCLWWELTGEQAIRVVWKIYAFQCVYYKNERSGCEHLERYALRAFVFARQFYRVDSCVLQMALDSLGDR